MADAAHTPGPWEFGKHTTRAMYVEVDGPGAWGLARVYLKVGAGIGNAKLIAAAPDLFVSLNEMVAELLAHASLGLNDDEVAMLKRAEAAIAKAKGPTP